MEDYTEVDLSTLEELGATDELPSKTYRIDFGNSRVSGLITESVMQQAVRKILLTPEETGIYLNGYGVNLEGLIGMRTEQLIPTLRERLEQAFSLDDRILGVKDMRVTRLSKDSVQVTIYVDTVDGGVLITEGLVL